ncbi:MAG TPA: RsmD family RNA methyltransferase, partial [Candidatus Pelethomonas intestinigallinarum]|nr:RsmD family RNA methyltransferase [Candidatus Pelethomonas intestinigallinarum]
MRVITGAARGRRLKELQGMETRPTTDRVKEGIFNIIQFDIEGRRVLDLFAGTGQLGIEALSRGAARAVFVEQRRDAAA